MISCLSNGQINRLGTTYDAFTGGYLQIDPLLEESWSPYIYVNTDPVGGDDRTGQLMKPLSPPRFRQFLDICGADDCFDLDPCLVDSFSGDTLFGGTSGGTLDGTSCDTGPGGSECESGFYPNGVYSASGCQSCKDFCSNVADRECPENSLTGVRYCVSGDSYDSVWQDCWDKSSGPAGGGGWSTCEAVCRECNQLGVGYTY